MPPTRMPIVCETALRSRRDPGDARGVSARVTVTILLGFVLTLAAAAPSALARGGSITQNLLEKGLRHLHQAERAYFTGAQDRARAEGTRAERVFEDAWAQDQSDPRTPMLGGQAAAFAQNLDAANKWLNRLAQASRLGEGDPDIHFLTAFVHLIGAKRPDRALRSLKRMHSLNPRARPIERDNLMFMAHRDFGRAYMDAEKWDEAISQFRSAARLAQRASNRGRELSMLGNIGMVMRRSDRLIEATEVFRSLLKAEPQDPLWHWHLALTLAFQSRMAEAIPHYREVIRMREAGQAGAGVYAELAGAYLRLGNCIRQVAEREADVATRTKAFEEAKSMLERYIKEAPDQSLGHKWLGVLLFEDLEQPYAALPHFRKAFELDEVCEDSLAYMIKIHERYPPPPDQLPKDDPEAAEAARKAWRAPIAAWKKNIQDGADRRQKIREERVKRTGEAGCD